MIEEILFVLPHLGIYALGLAMGIFIMWAFKG